MGRSIKDYNYGFSKQQAQIRGLEIDRAIRKDKAKVAAEYKKIVNSDSYGVQKKRSGEK